MTRRGTTNRNDRGSAASRRARKAWLLSAAAGFGGDGLKVPCVLCDTMLDAQTLTVDRHPITGCDGGTYKRDNIRPMCGWCNSSTGGTLGAQRRAECRDRLEG